jgi:hypothetical protein
MEKVLEQIVQFVGKEGAFAIGALFGVAISTVAHWLAGHERRLRHKLDLEREKELHSQLQLKDQRIDKLHEELRNFQKGLGGTSAKKQLKG